MKECLTCQFNQTPDLAPGGWIKEYNYWILEHINEPIPIQGWLVLKTKRHVEGVVGLNEEEAQELGSILQNVSRTLKELSNAEMIYIICFTELVKHLHFHIIPRYSNQNQKGPALLNLMDEVKADPSKAAPLDNCLPLIENLRQSLA